MTIVNANSLNWHSTSNPSNKVEFDNMIILFTAKITTGSSIKFGENVELHFLGGMLNATQPLTITGNQTVINAPMTQIFSEKISFDGSWKMPVAYPQWFGAKVYSAPGELTGSLVSATDAINKAISLKRNGEVHLPAGFYVIDGPIKIPLGIRLIGEQGLNASQYAGKAAYATVLMCSPSFSMNSADSIKRIIEVNVAESSGSLAQDIPFAQPVTYIEHLQLKLFGANSDTDMSTVPIGILLGMGAKINNVTFSDIPVAVKTISAYIDAKQIINCIYSNSLKINNSEDSLYAFDLMGLGDALEFRHNLIHGSDVGADKIGYNALRLQSTGGAVVSDNVLNADVEILNSKAVIFRDNHMGYGAQVRVYCSVATISTNYIEKRERPSIAIRGNHWGHKSQAVLINNAFVCRSFYNTVGSSYNPDNFYNLDVEKIVAQVNNFSEYDLLVSNYADVTIKNCFRYWLSLPGNSDMCPTGILIAKSNLEYDKLSTDTEELSSFEDFNDYSYFLSFNGRIQHCVVQDFRYSSKNIQAEVETRFIPRNTNGVWLGIDIGNEENYTIERIIYRLQYVWDYRRCILKHNAGSDYLTFYVVDKKKQVNIPTEGEFGQPLFLLSKANNVKAIRIIRNILYLDEKGRNKEIMQYVDIPLCGCSALYDNGTNVNGYHWKSTIMSSILQCSNNTITGVKFEGANVECRASSSATSSGVWQRGDMFVNTDNSSTNNWTVRVK